MRSRGGAGLYGSSRIGPKSPVTAPFDGRVMSFSHIFQSDAWEQPRVSHSILRFLDKAGLAHAGLMIEAQFGDWDRSPFTDASPEIITIARRA
jgi:hypothetical protein